MVQYITDRNIEGTKQLIDECLTGLAREHGIDGKEYIRKTWKREYNYQTKQLKMMLALKAKQDEREAAN